MPLCVTSPGGSKRQAWIANASLRSAGTLLPNPRKPCDRRLMAVASKSPPRPGHVWDGVCLVHSAIVASDPAMVAYSAVRGVRDDARRRYARFARAIPTDRRCARDRRFVGTWRARACLRNRVRSKLRERKKLCRVRLEAVERNERESRPPPVSTWRSRFPRKSVELVAGLVLGAPVRPSGLEVTRPTSRGIVSRSHHEPQFRNHRSSWYS